MSFELVLPWEGTGEGMRGEKGGKSGRESFEFITRTISGR